MHLIKAIPIARGVGTDLLSYRSGKDILPGSVIRVPLRKRTVGAIVISSEPAADFKSEIKSADFEIKKITSQSGRSLISPEFFKVAEEAARFQASALPSVLFNLIPAPILADYEKLPHALPLTKRNKSRQSLVLQKDDETRFGHYKSLIRERFARKESIFMMMPTIEDIKKACAYFEKGIEPYTYIFHSGLSKTELVKKWKEALTDEHPIIIVATGAFLSLPRHDIGLIIVERENSRSYKGQERPFTDMRFVAEKLSHAIGADLLLGDSCLRIETLWRQDETELVDYAPLSMRSLSTARDTLVDMKAYKNPGHEFRILSDELVALLRANKTDNALTFIFAGRKGLSPQTICSDCESTLTCESCSAPLVLHGKDDKRFFLCNKCGARHDAHTVCRICGSWRLATLGIGTERVEEEVRTVLPDAKIFRFDKLSAPTHKKALELAEAFYNSPGSVCIGTEYALLYLDRQTDSSAIASLDALFSIPDFRINEKIFSIILRMRALARKNFILQTRNPEAAVLSQGVKGNIIEFYREEIAARKQFSFPPFSLFIKISYAGEKEETLEAMEQLKLACAGWNVTVFPAFIATVRGEHIMHALIKVPRAEWPNTELLERLRSLSPAYAVNVDPESIL